MELAVATGTVISTVAIRAVGKGKVTTDARWRRGGWALSLTSLGIEIGSIVGGKFRVERVLAEGGMGLVAAAMHLQLEQMVALKFYRRDIMRSSESRERFMREAKAAAQLKSEHVARVLDVGVGETGALYIVMEYLEGQGLERAIAAETSLDPSSACEYAIQACEALAEAHARGIVHRDIKPSNLFLAERAGWRAVKVLDFGVSKIALAQASNITTNLNVVMGTPCYMSPEQIHSAATVDHRSDIWSLGATLYQMLTGRPPFDPSLPILALAEEITSKDLPSVSELRSDVPRALSDVVARCLDRDRGRRMPSAADLAAALVPFAPARAQQVAERAATLAGKPGVGTRAAAAVVTTPAVTTPPAGIASPTDTPLAIVWPQIELDAPDAAPGAGERVAPPVEAWFTPRAIALLAAGSILLCVFAFLILPRLVQTSRGNGRPPGRPAVAAAPDPAEQPPAGGTATLVVYVSPPTAQIVVDGVIAVGNPYRGQFARGSTHVVKAFASGFEPRVEQANMNGDAVLNLNLDRSQRLPWRRSMSLGRTVPTRAAGGSPARVADGVQGRDSASTTGSSTIDPHGGRAPLHPIVTVSPYDSP